jgi:hypothetical protein
MIVAFFLFKKEANGTPFLSVYFFLGSLLSLAIAIFVVVVISVIVFETTKYREVRPYNNINLVSLSNGVETEGRFVLGFGSVNGQEYYYYFVHNGEGFVRGKVPVNSSVIIEGDNKPVITVEKSYSLDENCIWTLGKMKVNPYYRIYVPKDTVVQRFKVE